MYDDSPDWRVLFNLLRAMYQKHPVRIDIAGTVESIAQIDDKLLYRCYNTFYNLNNMVLAIAGNFDPDVVVRLCDKILKKAPLQTIQSKRVDEPMEIEKDYVEERLPVSMPIFSMGYKVEPKPVETSALDQITSEILLDILAGESSPLYRRLYDKGLINATFSNEVFAGRDYYSLLFSGESPDPKAVRDELIKEVERLKKEGIAQEDFDRAKKANYGR